MFAAACPNAAKRPARASSSLSMAISRWLSAISTLFCRNASVAASTRTSTASFRRSSPWRISFSPRCDDADFVQSVDRHAGVQLARCSPLHRLTHVRESSVDQQPCRLIHQKRDEQDAADSEPECRRRLTLHHAETEPPQRTDHDRGNGGDDEAEPDSEREFGHETRLRRSGLT